MSKRKPDPALLDQIRDAIRRAMADTLNGQPNGNIVVKGCIAANYVDPEDAAANFFDTAAKSVASVIAGAAE